MYPSVFLFFPPQKRDKEDVPGRLHIKWRAHTHTWMPKNGHAQTTCADGFSPVYLMLSVTGIRRQLTKQVPAWRGPRIHKNLQVMRVCLCVCLSVFSNVVFHIKGSYILLTEGSSPQGMEDLSLYLLLRVCLSVAGLVCVQVYPLKFIAAV